MPALRHATLVAGMCALPALAVGAPAAAQRRPAPAASAPAIAAGRPASGAAATQPATESGPLLDLSAFLAAVGRANLELAAQRARVAAAAARIAVAQVFPDPSLEVGLAAVDIGNQGAPAAAGVGLSLTVELGGKRRARVRAAELEHSSAQAELQDFLHQLRSKAAAAFIDALAARQLLEGKRRTLVGLERLVAINLRRLRAGDIGEMALLQARNEAQRFRADVLAAQAEVEVAAQELRRLAALPAAPTRLRGSLALEERRFDVEELVRRGQAGRALLLARRRAADATTAKVRLARANRWVDVAFGLGWQHTAAGSGPFQAPAYNSLSASVSVPLPFSRIYRGEVAEALALRRESQHLLRAAELQVEIEVRQAHVRYQAAGARRRLFRQGVVADAEKVRDAVLYQYSRGGATLVEVLTAQRAFTDISLEHVAILREHAQSLLALEQAANLWDLRL